MPHQRLKCVRAAVDGWGVAGALLRPGSGGAMRRAWLRPNEESGTAQTRARASSQAAEMGSVGGAYISADELLSHPSLAGSPGGRGRAASAPQLSRHSLRYDMDAHYRFGGAIPRAPKQQWPPVYRELLVFIGRQGTPGVMPSAPSPLGARAAGTRWRGTSGCRWHRRCGRSTSRARTTCARDRRSSSRCRGCPNASPPRYPRV
eukprot:COSAG01_NODE_2431_length_7709_cov_5.388173_7_plen_204_part_00